MEVNWFVLCRNIRWFVIAAPGKDPTRKGVTAMKRSGWTARLLLILVAALTLVVTGDALAGGKNDKKDEKDKKSKKGKKEQIEKKESRKSESATDATRAQKSEAKKRSGAKVQGSRGSSSKSQAQTRSQKRSRKRSQKRSCKRSGGGKK